MKKYVFQNIPSGNDDWIVTKSFTLTNSYTLLSSDNILSGIILASYAKRRTKYDNMEYVGIKGTVKIENLKFQHTIWIF